MRQRSQVRRPARPRPGRRQGSGGARAGGAGASSLAGERRSRARAGRRRIDPGGRVRRSARPSARRAAPGRRLPSRAGAHRRTRTDARPSMSAPADRARRGWARPGARWSCCGRSARPPAGRSLGSTDAGDRARGERERAGHAARVRGRGRTISWPVRRATWSCAPACARCCAELNGRCARTPPDGRRSADRSGSARRQPARAAGRSAPARVRAARPPRGRPRARVLKAGAAARRLGIPLDGSTRTVDSHASRLRRKLQERGGGRWVINVWGVGYRLR